MNTYYTRATPQGTLVRLSIAITDATTKQPADPGSVSCAVLRPDTTAVSPAPTVAKDSIGNYHADVDIAGWVGGVAQYTFSGTAPYEITAYGEFNVSALGF